MSRDSRDQRGGHSRRYYGFYDEYFDNRELKRPRRIRKDNAIKESQEINSRKI